MDIENKYENTCLDIFMNEVDKSITPTGKKNETNSL